MKSQGVGSPDTPGGYVWLYQLILWSCKVVQLLFPPILLLSGVLAQVESHSRSTMKTAKHLFVSKLARDRAYGRAVRSYSAGLRHVKRAYSQSGTLAYLWIHFHCHWSRQAKGSLGAWWQGQRHSSVWQQEKLKRKMGGWKTCWKIQQWDLMTWLESKCTIFF